jgi:high-affinity nickel-transport protein
MVALRRLASALLNLVVLVGLVRGARSGDELEALLRSRGLMNRLLGRFSERITESWHMYPLGVVFGLGFDTATEVGLLLLAAGAAGAGLPWYAILSLPILFAAGMALLDTLDGSFMNFAYGWAFSEPVRKLYYNLTITGLSVVVALAIGTIELLSIAAQRLDGGFWDWISGIDLNTLGYVVFGLFALTWAAAVAIWRFAHIEERWARQRS